jgi:hypothetical protein
MMSQSQLSFVFSNEIDPAPLTLFKAPPDLNWEGQRWVRVDHLANQRRGAKKSQVWDLSDEYISLNSSDTYAWYYQIYIPEVLISLLRKSITAVIRYLKRKYSDLLEDDSSDIIS